MRTRDILNAIQSALVATDAFDDDGVFLWGSSDAAEQGADKTRSVAIIPLGDVESDRFDGAPAGVMFEDFSVKLVVSARDEDKQKRDEDADRLMSVCRNALNANALNVVLGQPVVYPAWTKVGRSTWKEPKPPQRDVEAIFQFRYDSPTWDGFDASP